MISVAEIPGGGFHGFRGGRGRAIISQISFLKWVHPRREEEQRQRAGRLRPPCGKRAAAWRRPRRARWNPKTFPTQPHSHAWTRAHAHEYRFIAAMGATTPRRNENERPIPRDTRGDVSAGRRESISIRTRLFIRIRFLRE